MPDPVPGPDVAAGDPLPAYKTEPLLRTDLSRHRERYLGDREQLGDAPAVLLRLLDMITSRKLPIGSMLPARRVLLELYGVKKETIEQVWRHLGDAGAIHSRKRAGTTVAAAPSWRDCTPGPTSGPHRRKPPFSGNGS